MATQDPGGGPEARTLAACERPLGPKAGGWWMWPGGGVERNTEATPSSPRSHQDRSRPPTQLPRCGLTDPNTLGGLRPIPGPLCARELQCTRPSGGVRGRSHQPRETTLKSPSSPPPLPPGSQQAKGTPGQGLGKGQPSPQPAPSPASAHPGTHGAQTSSFSSEPHTRRGCPGPGDQPSLSVPGAAWGPAAQAWSQGLGGSLSSALLSCAALGK